MQRDLGAVLDILLACRDIQDCTRGLSRQDFERNKTVRHAVVRCIEVIGEATKRISPAFRAAHPEIPWQAMAGMRDRLIHEYDRVDLDVVWNVVERRARSRCTARAVGSAGRGQPGRSRIGTWSDRGAVGGRGSMLCGFTRGSQRRNQPVSMTFLKLHVVLHQLAWIVIALRGDLVPGTPNSIDRILSFIHHRSLQVVPAGSRAPG
jgi:uncharacterized protein with HEPN domain